MYPYLSEVQASFLVKSSAGYHDNNGLLTLLTPLVPSLLKSGLKGMPRSTQAETKSREGCVTEEKYPISTGPLDPFLLASILG